MEPKSRTVCEKKNDARIRHLERKGTHEQVRKGAADDTNKDVGEVVERNYKRKRTMDFVQTLI